MANCADCGTKLGFMNSAGGGRCVECTAKINRVLAAEQATKAAVVEENRLIQEAAIHGVLLTTETAPSVKITKRIEIVTAECAFGMNIFKDLFAGVRDIVGGRSEAVQKTLRDSRRTVLFELKREAHSVGANAVVGVDLDYIELSGNSTMILLVASGTAVLIDEE